MKRPASLNKRQSFRGMLLMGLIFVLMFDLNINVTAQNSGEITVCASGCDFASVEAAVQAASDGDLIIISNGTYLEIPFLINKNLTLRGQSINTTILRNTQQQATFLQIAQGNVIRVNIENLTLESGCAQPIPNCVGDGISVSGNAIVQLDEIRVINHGGTAIKVNNSAIARVNNSSIFGNGLGLDILDTGQIDIAFTGLDGNTFGIDINGTDTSRLNLNNSTISNNGTGIIVSTDETNGEFLSSVTLFNVQVGNNGIAGFSGGGNVTIENSSIFLNGGTGIQFFGSGLLNVFQSRILLNTDDGVDLKCPGNSSCARIAENEIIRNGLVGLIAEASMLIVCRDNFIRDNTTNYSTPELEQLCSP